ncbi:hypothetical protein [Helicobacter sp. 23-1045]
MRFKANFAESSAFFAESNLFFAESNLPYSLRWGGIIHYKILKF